MMAHMHDSILKNNVRPQNPSGLVAQRDGGAGISLFYEQCLTRDDRHLVCAVVDPYSGEERVVGRILRVNSRRSDMTGSLHAFRVSVLQLPKQEHRRLRT